MNVETKTVEERFWPMVDKRGPNEHWMWKGGANPAGYGTIFVKGSTRAAHRISWTIANGTPPKGWSIIHTCDQRLCVNPAHLLLTDDLTMKFNGQRHTHCPKGHPLTDANTVGNGKGKRTCKTCRYEHAKRRYQWRKAQALALGRAESPMY